jgi:diketogulonate reductase-like aldo/keto reductase
MTTTPEIPIDAATLPQGGQMPLLGFGTWQLKGDDAVTATAAALEVGYRHLDTATIYGNEGEVGRALAESGVDRDDVFLTTKVNPRLAGKERETIEESLALLGTDRVDLWLIHWPGEDGQNVSMWKALVDAQQAGRAREIGVSNFSLAMIDELVEATGVSPAVNQIEWSPLLFDADVLEGHRARSVLLEGYSGLRGGILEHDVVTAIAEDLDRTPAQVVLRWHLQHGIVAIPKSGDPERVRSNADLAGFELSAEDMAALDGLGGSAG